MALHIPRQCSRTLPCTLLSIIVFPSLKFDNIIYGQALAWREITKKNLGHNTYIILVCMYVPGKLMTDLQMSFCVKSRQS